MKGAETNAVCLLSLNDDLAIFKGKAVPATKESSAQYGGRSSGMEATA